MGACIDPDCFRDHIFDRMAFLNRADIPDCFDNFILCISLQPMIVKKKYHQRHALDRPSGRLFDLYRELQICRKAIVSAEKLKSKPTKPHTT